MKLSSFENEKRIKANLLEKISIHFPNKYRDNKVISDICRGALGAASDFKYMFNNQQPNEKKQSFMESINARNKISSSKI